MLGLGSLVMSFQNNCIIGTNRVIMLGLVSLVMSFQIILYSIIDTTRVIMLSYIKTLRYDGS